MILVGGLLALFHCRFKPTNTYFPYYRPRMISPTYVPPRIVRELVCPCLSKSLKRSAPFANIALASALMSGSIKVAALGALCQPLAAQTCTTSLRKETRSRCPSPFPPVQPWDRVIGIYSTCRNHRFSRVNAIVLPTQVLKTDALRERYRHSAVRRR